MFEQAKTAFKLVPEIALLESLPLHLRQRFARALNLMYEELGEKKSWKCIAAESAISQYHFHRQFTELFNETPRQYLSRLRLQVAVNLLLNSRSWSVTEIALYCGYSSSQALGKALKRELDVTAKQIRKMGYESTPSETADFIAKLAHPGSLEAELAKGIHSELIWYPKRGVRKIAQPFHNWDSVMGIHSNNAVQLLGVTPISHFGRVWANIETIIGDWSVDDKHYDFIVPEGYYLCAEVYLVSDVGYCAALGGLFDIAQKQKFEIDSKAFLVEFMRDIESNPIGGATISFQLPIITP